MYFFNSDLVYLFLFFEVYSNIIQSFRNFNFCSCPSLYLPVSWTSHFTPPNFILFLVKTAEKQQIVLTYIIVKMGSNYYGTVNICGCLHHISHNCSLHIVNFKPVDSLVCCQLNTKESNIG